MRCDVDHARAWEHGGRTDIDNLEHLCRKHHRLKHELGWQAGHEGGGVLTWTSPVGRPYRSEPARRVESRRAPPESGSPPARRRTEQARIGPTRPRAAYPEDPPF